MSYGRALCLLLISTVGIAFGCDRADESRTQTAAQTAVQKDESAVPSRIVSLAPSVTETLFALGVGERVVGVTRFCDFPDEAKQLQKVGGLTDVDVEVVLSLNPDLVIGVSSKSSSGLERTLAAADAEILFLPVETFDDVEASMRTLGTRVGASERGEELATRIAEINAPDPHGPTVLVLFGRDPWIGAGPDTFADEMVRRAGGRNALSDLDQPYPTLDVERLTTLEPDLIFDTSWGDGRQAPIPAVKPHAVVRVDPVLIRPGPRLNEAMKLFSAAIASRGGDE